MQGIAIDLSGNIYVTDSSNNRIEKFDRNGNFLTKWGSAGTDDGQFHFPTGVAVDSSYNVYVVDTGNQRVQKFSKDGQFLTQWGSRGITDGHFIRPLDITIDSSRNVYVLDYGWSSGIPDIVPRVEKFTNIGSFLTQWGSRGSDDGKFEYPEGITTDTKMDTVYVSDTFNNRIQVPSFF